MASNITLHDDAGNPITISGEQLSAVLRPQVWQQAELTNTGATFLDGTPKYRVLGGTYTNNTGKPIMVSISPSIPNTAGDITVDGVSIIKTQSRTTDSKTSYTFIVPNGSTYRQNTSAFSLWAELR